MSNQLRQWRFHGASASVIGKAMFIASTINNLMASPALISPIRARLAFKASRLLQNAFVCKRCLQQRSKAARIGRAPIIHKSTRQTPFLNAFRAGRRQTARNHSSVSPTSPLGALSQTIRSESHNKPKSSSSTSSSSSSSSWPETSSRGVAIWLLLSAGSVFGIVVFGGLTRLTESGLSITEWRPVTGSLPPRNQAAWEEEFERYKRSPEFKMLNSRMGLEEFKKIYWMEWTHRLWGRVVGISFLLPTVYFIARRRVSRIMALRLIGIAGLIGFQGGIGWWMVKSGLKDNLFEQGSHPRVSQYRLAAHLGTAFTVYVAMLWNGLSILRAHRLLANPAEATKLLETLQSSSLRPFKRSLAALSALVGVTVMSGAFVAGLDAGLVYNDFPWMGHPNFIPSKRELLDPFYSHDKPSQSDLLWRNMLENPVLAQLDHRILATTTFTAILALYAYSRRIKGRLPAEARKAVLGVVHLVSLQVAMGISTLWFLVPVWLGAAHQAGALALLTGVVILGRRVRVSGKEVAMVRRAMEKSARGQTGVGHGMKPAITP